MEPSVPAKLFLWYSSLKSGDEGPEEGGQQREVETDAHHLTQHRNRWGCERRNKSFLF